MNLEDEQAAADAALREAFPEPPPDLSVGFETRLRRRLDAPRAPARWRPARGFALAAYVTTAAFVSILVLSSLPWSALIAPKAIGLALAALAVTSPLMLLDRIGILRPPGD